MKRSLVLGSAVSAGVLALVALGASPALAQSSDQLFEQVMAAPDDVPLNIAFARAEAAEGHLLSAASTLERVLLMQPNNASARLTYATVLYRLDDKQGAREQLALVDPSGLSPAEQAEAARYRGLLGMGAAPVTRSGGTHGVFAAGVAYEEDGLGALRTQFEFPPFVSAASQEAWSAVLSGSIEGTTSLPSGSGVYGSASAYNSNSFSGADTDVFSGEVQLGALGSTASGHWKLGGVLRHVALDGESYQTELGVRGEYRWMLDADTRLTLTGEANHQEFEEPLVNLIGGDHEGGRYNVALTVAHRLEGETLLTATAGWEYKTAAYEPFGYTAPFLQAAFATRLNESGAYFNLSGSLRWVDYDRADPLFVAGAKREDTRARIRAALGVPVGALTGSFGDDDGPDIEGSLSYTSRQSTAPIADYDGLAAELRLIWRFGAQN